MPTKKTKVKEYNADKTRVTKTKVKSTTTPDRVTTNEIVTLNRPTVLGYAKNLFKDEEYKNQRQKTKKITHTSATGRDFPLSPTPDIPR